MQVTWEQFEDPLWIIIRLITSWMSTSCCFDGKCLSCKMPPLPSSLKKFSSVWSGAPRSAGNNENAAIATQLISKLCNLPVVVLFLPIYFTIIFQFLAFLLICSLGLYTSGNFPSLTSVCPKVKSSSSYTLWNGGVEFDRCQDVGILTYFFLWDLRHVSPIILKLEPNSIFSFSIYYKYLICV